MLTSVRFSRSIGTHAISIILKPNSSRVFQRRLLATATSHIPQIPSYFYKAMPISKEPVTITPSAAEIASGKLDERNLEIAVRCLYHDGLVVVKDAIKDISQVDKLNEKMVADARTLQARGEDSPYNYNKSNIQQDPPPIKKWFFEDVFLNPIATQITSTVLGPKPKLTFMSGNTAMPSTKEAPSVRQPVHSDADFAHPDVPFALVVNVPLVSMDAHNGSTEIWLGTHNATGLHAQQGEHGDRASGRIKQDILDKWQEEKQRGPLQPKVEKGSIIVRDLRLWHAGMPNNSEVVRPMIAMIHFAPWYRNRMRLELSEDVKPIIEKHKDVIQVPTDWISYKKAEETYLDRGFGNSYDFDQAP